MALQDTYLTMVKQVAGELNLAIPQYVVGNLNRDVIQIAALMLRAARELVHEYEWQALDKNYYFYTQYFTTTADTTQGSPVLQNVKNIGLAPSAFITKPAYFNVIGSTAQTNNVQVVSIDQTDPNNTKVTMNQNAQTTTTASSVDFTQQIYDLPSDYSALIDRTAWDSTRRWLMLGPSTPQEFQWLQQGYISTGPRIRYKLQNNKFNTWPSYATNERLAFEYRGNTIIVGSDGVTPQSTFQADTDLIIINEQLLVLFTKLKYWQIKGFDTQDVAMEFDRHLAISKSLDSSAKIISYAPNPAEVLINYQQIPDSGYGS